MCVCVYTSTVAYKIKKNLHKYAYVCTPNYQVAQKIN